MAGNFNGRAGRHLPRGFMISIRRRCYLCQEPSGAHWLCLHCQEGRFCYDGDVRGNLRDHWTSSLPPLGTRRRRILPFANESHWLSTSFIRPPPSPVQDPGASPHRPEQYYGVSHRPEQDPRVSPHRPEQESGVHTSTAQESDGVPSRVRRNWLPLVSESAPSRAWFTRSFDSFLETKRPRRYPSRRRSTVQDLGVSPHRPEQDNGVSPHRPEQDPGVSRHRPEQDPGVSRHRPEQESGVHTSTAQESDMISSWGRLNKRPRVRGTARSYNFLEPTRARRHPSRRMGQDPGVSPNRPEQDNGVSPHRPEQDPGVSPHRHEQDRGVYRHRPEQESGVHTSTAQESDLVPLLGRRNRRPLVRESPPSPALIIRSYDGLSEMPLPRRYSLRRRSHVQDPDVSLHRPVQDLGVSCHRPEQESGVHTPAQESDLVPSRGRRNRRPFVRESPPSPASITRSYDSLSEMPLPRRNPSRRRSHVQDPGVSLHRPEEESGEHTTAQESGGIPSGKRQKRRPLSTHPSSAWLSRSELPESRPQCHSSRHRSPDQEFGVYQSTVLESGAHRSSVHESGASESFVLQSDIELSFIEDFVIPLSPDQDLAIPQLPSVGFDIPISSVQESGALDSLVPQPDIPSFVQDLVIPLSPDQELATPQLASVGFDIPMSSVQESGASESFVLQSDIPSPFVQDLVIPLSPDQELATPQLASVGFDIPMSTVQESGASESFVPQSDIALSPFVQDLVIPLSPDQELATPQLASVGFDIPMSSVQESGASESFVLQSDIPSPFVQDLVIPLSPDQELATPQLASVGFDIPMSTVQESGASESFVPQSDIPLSPFVQDLVIPLSPDQELATPQLASVGFDIPMSSVQESGASESFVLQPDIPPQFVQDVDIPLPPVQAFDIPLSAYESFVREFNRALAESVQESAVNRSVQDQVVPSVPEINVNQSASVQEQDVPTSPQEQVAPTSPQEQVVPTSPQEQVVPTSPQEQVVPTSPQHVVPSVQEIDVNQSSVQDHVEPTSVQDDQVVPTCPRI